MTHLSSGGLILLNVLIFPTQQIDFLEINEKTKKNRKVHKTKIALQSLKT